NEPINLGDMNDKNDRGNGGEPFWILFHGPEQQQEKRREKVKQRNRADKKFPTAGDAVQIPADFVRQVSRPNNEQLRERNVSPKKRERQKQIAEVMKMRRRQHAGERRKRLEYRQQ